MSLSILFVPSVSKGNGSGHLMRCLSLARSLGRRAAVFVPEAKSETSWSAAELSLSYSRELVGVNLVTSLRDPARYGGGSGPWDLVVLDRRVTPLEELAFWERIAPVLAMDEGGEARASAHYLVDILPRLHSSRALEANKTSLGFLNLPLNRRSPPAEIPQDSSELRRRGPRRPVSFFSRGAFSSSESSNPKTLRSSRERSEGELPPSDSMVSPFSVRSRISGNTSPATIWSSPSSD